MKSPIKSLYLNNSFFVSLGLLCVLFVFAHIWDFLFFPSVVLLGVFACLLIIDALMLFSPNSGVESSRVISDRFSNGDENEVVIEIENRYPFNVNVEVIDRKSTRLNSSH